MTPPTNTKSKKTVVDTTIVADLLLKTDVQRERASNALAGSSATLLPAYGIKEFKAGPLHYYVWYHNKVVEASSWQEVVRVIQQNIGWRKNLPATALQALGDFWGSIGKEFPSDVGQRYPGMTLDAAQLTEFGVWLKQRIFRAWRKHRAITDAVISPLSCYVEKDLETLTSGQIDDGPLKCGVSDCSLRERYRTRLEDVRLLAEACTGSKPETVKRRRALDRLRSHPTKNYEEKHCRALGDAVFVLDCPEGGEILTTNVADHQPLADALGRTVRRP